MATDVVMKHLQKAVNLLLGVRGLGGVTDTRRLSPVLHGAGFPRRRRDAAAAKCLGERASALC